MSLPPLNWWRLLPVRTMKCKKDGTALHWETWGGMRVRHTTNRGPIYQARCPKCLKSWDVLAQKEQP